MYSLTSNSSAIKLAKYQNSSWNTQTIPLPPSSANLGNVVVDSKGYPHFIYTQPYQNSTTLSTILYASFNGTVWISQTVASKVSLGDDNPVGQLVLDSHGNPHFCYINSDGVPMYASYSGSAWNIQTISSNTSANGPCWLALDASGNPHISYRTASGARYTAVLMYATTNETNQATSTLVPEFPVLVILPPFLAVLSIAIAVTQSRRETLRQETS